MKSTILANFSSGKLIVEEQIVQLERFYLNGHIIIIGFHTKSQNFKPLYKTPPCSLGVKWLK